MRKLAAMGMALLMVGGVAACSDDSYDREDAIDQLVEESDGAIDEEQAACIVDAVEEEFGVEKLESNDDLTAEDEAKLGEITGQCLLGDLGDLLDDPTLTTVPE